MIGIGRAIRIIREAKGLRMTQLAQMADVSIPFLSLVEAGAREPSLAAMEKVASALGIPAEALVILARPETLRAMSDRSDGVVSLVGSLVAAEEALRRELDALTNKDETGQTESK
jgi:transcriptional regulator with XRE-family HTH domain